MFFVLYFVSRPLIHLFLQMLKYVLPYKCNCFMISKTFNFFNTLKSPDSLADEVIFTSSYHKVRHPRCVYN